MKRIARSAIVEHSAQQMYALVDDVESYPRFLPWCIDARVESLDGKKRATLTAGLRGLRQSFTTLNENRPAEAIDMRLLEGPFRRFNAAWRFRALSAQACAIDFSLEYEFSSRTLGECLEMLFGVLTTVVAVVFVSR